ncbi:MAG: 16S rRNA (guanine(527)-N(7))-methyltransferase RsmG [Janthinobacterium lividum]
MSTYLDLLLRWNARTNLTAIRDPERLVQRQIGESLFAAHMLPNHSCSLLDFGSGAGFPGIPLQLLMPGLKVSLAESQGKKSSFLREAVRVLGIRSSVWDRRVEDMAEMELFDFVAMRAVDNSSEMALIATRRVAHGGSLLRFVAAGELSELPGWIVNSSLQVPLSQGKLLTLQRS